ncbi:MAG: porin [Opitutales bacterium]|jgi:phosphate-selective porin OprO and OprP|nr:porin [Opitutales bacterium]
MLTRNKLTVRYRVLALAIGCWGILSGEVFSQIAYEDIWSNAVFYENKENPTVQKIAFTGRFQGESYWFDSDQGDADDSTWRRLRGGFKNTVFDVWTFHFEGDFNLNNDASYNRLTDAYISRKLNDGATVKIGKQSAGFTLGGATSSKSLITMQRNNLSNNMWFTAEYFTGISVSGPTEEGYFYKVGLFSNDPNGEFSHWDASFFGLFSVGKDHADQVGIDKAEVRFDYVYNDEDPRANTRNFGQVASIVTQWEDGNWGLWTDLSYGKGYRSQSDMWGLVLMPFYNINDKLQLVFRYTHLDSSDGNGVRLGRYESRILSGRGDKYDEFYAGFNVYFYGHKLKWQTGLQKTRMKDTINDGGELTDGLGLTTGFRISW